MNMKNWKAIWLMKSPANIKYCLKSALSLVALSVTPWLLQGCKGIATESENSIRNEQQFFFAEYRPEGPKPVLPPLTAESSLSNYLSYAVLNHPKVEVAYYDWAASIERITQARSL